MNNDKRFLSVGIFVLLGFGLIVAILLWFSESKRQSYNNYRVIFTEAVDGVSTSSTVKFNGVDVGQVFAVSLDPVDPSKIYVDVKVITKLHLTSAVYATVKSQGVTGMSYISLAMDKDVTSPQPIAIHNDEPYPIIASHSSLLTTITEQAQKIGKNLNTISSDITQLLNESNIQHVNHIMNNLDQVTSAVALQSASIEKTVKLVPELLGNINQNTQNLNSAIAQFSKLSQSLQSNSEQLGMVLDTIQNGTLTNINSILLPNLDQAVTNMNNVTAQFNELLRTVNSNPSVFVRGTMPAKPGPKE